MRQGNFFEDEGRALAWFSCGAASAVAAKLTLKKYGDRAEVIYCDTSEDEHPDNARFLRDVEEWLGIKIKRIRSDKYRDVFEVFEGIQFVAGNQGAPCTGQLKMQPAKMYRRLEDTNVYGFTADKREVSRAMRYAHNNFEQTLDFILIENGLTKADCFDVLNDAGIKRSAMYDLGFDNANCMGCVKARGAKYWARVRYYWPERFARLAAVSRKYGCWLIKHKGRTMFLDELPEDFPLELSSAVGESFECGVLCGSVAA
jgi:3'-phosphoadenosine 5'-phosphosulfate sulfotransferase (PAPS reductase)/FAD synthetase